MKKLGILALTLLLVASIFVSGCASNKEGNESGAKEASAITELKFGYQPSTHQIAYMTADAKGWWKADLAPFGITKINRITNSRQARLKCRLLSHEKILWMWPMLGQPLRLQL